MKQGLLLCFLFLSITIFAQPTEGLIAYYPFNGNADDAIGTNHGTITGATLTTGKDGAPNTAYRFDGTGHKIDVADNSILDFMDGNYTISFWAKYSESADKYVIRKGGNSYYVAFDVSSKGRILYFAGGVWGGYTVLDGEINDGAWHHHAMVRYASGANYYFVDGELRGINTGNYYYNGTNYQMNDNSDPLTFGQDFTGDIDEVRLYNRPLSLTEIQQLVGNAYQPAVNSIGSGLATQFNRVEDGDNGDIAVAPGSIDLNINNTQNYTFQFWIKLDPNQPVTNNVNETYSVIFEKWAHPFNLPLNFLCLVFNGVGNNPDKGKIQLSRSDQSDNWSSVLSIKQVDDNKQHHIAIVKQGTQLRLYIDGVLDATGTDNLTATSANNAPIIFGKRFNNFHRAKMDIDEFSFWDAAFSEEEIRDGMCQIVTPAHPKYASLKMYIPFNDSNLASARDIKGGYDLYFGETWPTSNSAVPLKSMSVAPLGNASSSNYSANPSATITHPQGESFTATATAGSPQGIHVYLVDTVPNSYNGITIGDNNRYFGVFQAGGTNPQYTATYNYTGSPYVNADNESSLRLAKRADNSVPDWQVMSTVPNTAANTITVTGESTEYILTGINLALPLRFLSFSAQKCDDDVCLNWLTTGEEHTSQFVIERSADNIAYTAIGNTAALNQPGEHRYDFTDLSPSGSRSFYRLKQVDLDGKFTYSNTVAIDFSNSSRRLTVFPNPAGNEITLIYNNTYRSTEILDGYGRTVGRAGITERNTYNIAQLSSGIYFLRVIDRQGRHAGIARFIKR
ncbi:MAG: T9SS type A sorting domain-containing protein [Agriterribacter sp.]